MACLYPKEMWSKFSLYLGTILVLVGLLVTVFFVVRQGENSMTKKRFQIIDKAC